MEQEHRRMPKIGVIGSGSGTNFEAIQQAILRGELDAEVVCVISDVDSAGILARADSHGIPCRFISPEPYKTKLDGDAESEYIRYLKEHGAEYVVLAGFMRMIKGGLLKDFPERIINIHPSLLPSFPGLAAWKQALEFGVKITGCTVHYVDAGMDTGRIIHQRCTEVYPDDTPESLHARIQIEEHKAYPEALARVFKGTAPR
jgi:phosphoribosylglycinamide formyltransferase-1